MAFNVSTLAQQEGGEVDVGTELVVEPAASEDLSCYIKLDARPITGLPASCPPGQDDDDLLFCYDDHSSDYECVGPFCQQRDCPSDYRDTGLGSCLKPNNYFARVKSWWPFRYRSCDSGYRRSGGMCIWNERCPDGMADLGLVCAKGNYMRAPLGGKQCPSGSEFINELGLIGATCFGACENGTEHDLLPTCFGSCPAGTTLCGGEGIGTLCLDNNGKTCDAHLEEIAEYAVDWTVAITSQNWFDIVNMIAGEHPNVNYPVCSDW